MPPKKPAPSRPQTNAEIIAEALKEAEADHQKRLKQQRRRRKRGGDRFGEWPARIRLVLLILVGLAVLVIGDGMRREGGEMRATLADPTGEVEVLKKGAKVAVPASKQVELADQDVITTKANSTTTVVFPDGSAVFLEPNTRFEVRLLGYGRGGVRDRSFLLHAGSMIANVGRFFGARSRAAFSTPTAVAAVRGTGFQVFHDSGTGQTFVAVVEGTVEVRHSAGRRSCQAGQLVVATPGQVGRPQPLAAPAQARISARVQQLKQNEKPAGLLDTIEGRVNNFLDPVLQVIGVAPGGWQLNATDGARRTACTIALTRMRTHIEMLPGEDAPDTINLATLQELQLPPQERDALLNAFAGSMLESYQKTGRNLYVVRARARDKKQTLYEMSALGAPRQIDE